MTVCESSDNLYHNILEYEQSIAQVLILIECLKNAGARLRLASSKFKQKTLHQYM